MNSLPPQLERQIYQALFGASIGYLVVSVWLLLPTGFFGVCHVALAITGIVGSARGMRSAKDREKAAAESTQKEQ